MAGAHGERRPRTKAFVLAWSSIVLVSLHFALAGQLSIFGSTPNFLLVLIATYGFLLGAQPGCIAGFALGLVCDLCSMGPVGFSALFGCLVGYVLGSFFEDSLSQGWQTPSIAFAVCSLVFEALYLAFLVACGFIVYDGLAVIMRILASALADSLIGVIAFFIVSRVPLAASMSDGGGYRIG